MSGQNLSGAYIATTGQIADAVQSALQEWAPVSSTTLAAAATSIDITGLDGDTDEIYKIDLFLVAGSTTLGTITGTINNDGGANYNYSYVGGTSGGQTTFATGWNLDSDLDGKKYGGNSLELRAKTEGYYRLGTNRWWSGGATNLFAFSWENTADNITSLKYTSTQADAFGIGTIIKVYKKAL